MTMRRKLPYLAALALGCGSAGLAACADGGPENGLPADAGSSLKSQLEDIRVTVDSAECDRLSRELRHVITRIDGLPSDVDAQLRQRLRDGYDQLKDEALRECNSNREDQQTQTTTTETQTTTTPETPTATTPETPTATTPPPTATTPAPPPPVNPSPVNPPPPPNQGGGTPPEVVP